MAVDPAHGKWMYYGRLLSAQLPHFEGQLLTLAPAAP
jgi:hypothetical protein